MTVSAIKTLPRRPSARRHSQLAAVVLPNGTVGDVTVLQSLDTRFGLDDQAVIAVKQWLPDEATP